MFLWKALRWFFWSCIGIFNVLRTQVPLTAKILPLSLGLLFCFLFCLSNEIFPNKWKEPDKLHKKQQMCEEWVSDSLCQLDGGPASMPFQEHFKFIF